MPADGVLAWIWKPPLLRDTYAWAAAALEVIGVSSTRTVAPKAARKVMVASVVPGPVPVLMLIWPAVSLPEIETVPPAPSELAAMVGAGPCVTRWLMVRGPEMEMLRTAMVPALSDPTEAVPTTLMPPLKLARPATVRAFWRVVVPVTTRLLPTFKPVAAVLPVIFSCDRVTGPLAFKWPPIDRLPTILELPRNRASALIDSTWPLEPRFWPMVPSLLRSDCDRFWTVGEFVAGVLLRVCEYRNPMAAPPRISAPNRAEMLAMVVARLERPSQAPRGEVFWGFGAGVLTAGSSLWGGMLPHIGYALLEIILHISTRGFAQWLKLRQDN